MRLLLLFALIFFCPACFADNPGESFGPESTGPASTSGASTGPTTTTTTSSSSSSSTGPDPTTSSTSSTTGVDTTTTTTEPAGTSSGTTGDPLIDPDVIAACTLLCDKVVESCGGPDLAMCMALCVARPTGQPQACQDAYVPYIKCLATVTCAEIFNALMDVTPAACQEQADGVAGACGP